MELLVTTDWLAKEMGASDLRIIDATWLLPGGDRNAAQEYEAGHIPGALFLDLDEIADKNSPIPNMLPPAEKFSSRMQSLGIGDGSRIVIYDSSPLASAARAWWMFNIFGAHGIALLDGGIAKWKAEGRELESGKPILRHRHFTSWMDDAGIRSKADILANLDSGAEQLLDARGAERFEGATPEPRADVEAGHIPRSLNLPHSAMFNQDGTWKQGDALRAAFVDAGVDLNRPLVTSCGSGMTAAVLLFGLKLLGKDDVALYDGSWTEWGSDPATPKETGKG
jgi:thiosulfate/3-mercaptopyruvate sulfurtransferase